MRLGTNSDSFSPVDSQAAISAVAVPRKEFRFASTASTASTSDTKRAKVGGRIVVSVGSKQPNEWEARSTSLPGRSGPEIPYRESDGVTCDPQPRCSLGRLGHGANR